MSQGAEPSPDPLIPGFEFCSRCAVDYIIICAWVLLLPLTDFEFCSVFVKSHSVSEVADCVCWGFAEGEHPGDEADL
jgi:hypothetical protein